MGYFYIDDSVHDSAGFIIGACIYTDADISDKVANVIESHGFNSDKFEYKSSANYLNEPEKAKIRSDLKTLMHQHSKLGIVIIPREQRKQLGIECIKGLKQFVNSNKNLEKPLNVFFDQGMFTSIDKPLKLIKDLNLNEHSFSFEQDSKIIKGIQLADLAAHISSIQLKDKMGLVTKMIKAGPNSGYDPDMELGFEMWATLRYTFFNRGGRKYREDEDRIKSATLDVEPNGLYISEFCNKDLSNYARAAFSKVYLGCIY